MGATTKITWTDATFNPWRGCAKVHTGCEACYAWREAKRFPGMRGVWGPNGTRVLASASMWRQPLKWNREAEKAGVRKRVFCASLADVFEDWKGVIVNQHGSTMHRSERLPRSVFGLKDRYMPIPSATIGESVATMDDLRRDLFKLIDATPWLDWLLLTKRPENVRRMWVPKPPYSAEAGYPNADAADRAGPAYYRNNVWLGTSISDQKTVQPYTNELLKCRDLCPVLFLSAEPLVGPVNVREYLAVAPPCPKAGIDWVIVGGESGGKAARMMHPQWATDLRDQCVAAGVPFFFKQWGEWVPGMKMGHVVESIWPDGKVGAGTFGDNGGYGCNMTYVGKDAAGDVLFGLKEGEEDGKQWHQFPEVTH